MAEPRHPHTGTVAHGALRLSSWLKGTKLSHSSLLAAGVYAALVFRTIDQEICPVLPIGIHFLMARLDRNGDVPRDERSDRQTRFGSRERGTWAGVVAPLLGREQTRPGWAERRRTMPQQQETIRP
jgi:hypothetical protein